jgi:LysM repeat protein
LKVHTVRRGETVRTISRRYDTTPERIMKLNGMKRAVIFPGQSIVVSSSGGRTTTSRAAKPSRMARRAR